VAAAVAVAAGGAAIVSFGGGDGTQAQGGLPSKETVLSTLTPEERQYVEWVSSAPPAQVAAAFGTYRVPKPRPILHPRANVR
jgi:hypothetical protein